MGRFENVAGLVSVTEPPSTITLAPAGAVSSDRLPSMGGDGVDSGTRCVAGAGTGETNAMCDSVGATLGSTFATCDSIEGGAGCAFGGSETWVFVDGCTTIFFGGGVRMAKNHIKAAVTIAGIIMIAVPRTVSFA